MCDLLLSGGMTVLFRKGGIDEKGFWVEADEFLLFPTYFHQNRDKVRPEYVEAFDSSLESGPPEGVVRVPGFARVVEAIEVRRPETIHELADLHPYDKAQIEMRLEFRPKKPLVLLAVQAVRFDRPLETSMRDEFAGCTSWVPLGLKAEMIGAPALPRSVVEDVAARVRATVG